MTTEELNQIRQVVREEIQAETEPINKRLAGMDKRFESLEQKLNQSITDNAGFFHETWNRFDEIKDSQEKRIEIIEETLGLDEQPHKN